MATAEIYDEAATKSSGPKKATGRLQCVVVTPERTLIDELVGFVAIPLFDGELGVLPARPLIARLGYGELRVDLQGVVQRYFIDGGFVQIRDDVVTVLTHRAVPAAKLDVALIAAELERARAMPAATDAQIAEKERAIARARGQSLVASHAFRS